MLESKYMTTSGVCFSSAVWYFGCVVIRNAENKEAVVTAYNGLAAAGDPFWKYLLGKDDPRSIRLMREDPLHLPNGIYCTLGPDTTFIAYFRKAGP